MTEALTDLLRQALDDSLTDDADHALTVFEKIRAIATVNDLPQIVEAMSSPSADFWVREMLAEPVAEHGGLEWLAELLTAYERNLADGWDNDSFSVFLIEIIETSPTEAFAQLHLLRKSHPETVDWLLEFCEP